MKKAILTTACFIAFLGAWNAGKHTTAYVKQEIHRIESNAAVDAWERGYEARQQELLTEYAEIAVQAYETVKVQP